MSRFIDFPDEAYSTSSLLLAARGLSISGKGGFAAGMQPCMYWCFLSHNGQQQQDDAKVVGCFDYFGCSRNVVRPRRAFFFVQATAESVSQRGSLRDRRR